MPSSTEAATTGNTRMSEITAHRSQIESLEAAFRFALGLMERADKATNNEIVYWEIVHGIADALHRFARDSRRFVLRDLYKHQPRSSPKLTSVQKATVLAFYEHETLGRKFADIQREQKQKGAWKNAAEGACAREVGRFRKRVGSLLPGPIVLSDLV